ncbi:WYL domain-containing protein [Aliikangiella marina]|uniref:WYL domain-containing protein n=1 Tax=Aliikangiella marina TaxID=1712262 RepID=A0A545TD67_9GAMM|nr:WYL domain-containing protein [Aliikangiella marina]TQV75162.1 WYL domain-containing protein [Aliikangiella marina]
MARQSSDTDWSQRWDLLLRYRLIETIALWEGRLTTNHLRQAFGIGRQQASKDINFYNSEIAPNNLEYDTKLKGYRPSESFSCVVTKGDINEYLYLLASRQDLSSKIEYLDISQANITSISPPLRNVKPEFVRPIIEAARDRMRVEIQYTSLSKPEPRDRMIAPHTLVFNGYRWHVRAFCEETNMFKDFLLSRMTDISEITLKAQQSEADDEDWNQFVEIIVEPDKRLNNAQQKVIEHDFAMMNGQMIIKTRAPLVTYYLQLLRIDKSELHPIPAAQQLVVTNRSELEKWLLPE